MSRLVISLFFFGLDVWIVDFFEGNMEKNISSRL